MHGSISARSNSARCSLASNRALQSFVGRAERARRRVTMQTRHFRFDEIGRCSCDNAQGPPDRVPAATGSLHPQLRWDTNASARSAMRRSPCWLPAAVEMPQPLFMTSSKTGSGLAGRVDQTDTRQVAFRRARVAPTTTSRIAGPLFDQYQVRWRVVFDHRTDQRHVPFRNRE